MERFEFDNREGAGRANSTRKNGVTTRGAIELWGTEPDLLWLDIQGPFGAKRGSARLDPATAAKVGIRLLQWADDCGFRFSLGDLPGKILPDMAGRMLPDYDPTIGTPEVGYHPGSVADPRD